MGGSDKINKVHLQKGGEDFIVLVEDRDAFDKWKSDSSTPLAQVVEMFKVFTTHGHGVQGVLDTASQSTLEGAFGTTDVDEIIKTVLLEGTLQSTSTATRFSSTNDSKGAMANHR